MQHFIVQFTTYKCSTMMVLALTVVAVMSPFGPEAVMDCADTDAAIIWYTEKILKYNWDTYLETLRN